MSEVRYQVFVSSTFQDLRTDRQQATQSILELGYFPSTMEMFPASDETQWQLIQRVIKECDYYIVIVAGRYGSLAPGGVSYTEMEYDFAVEQGIPVFGFVKKDIQKLPAEDVDSDPVLVSKLEAFRKKVMSRSCRQYGDSNELGMAVMKSLVQASTNLPRTGWVKASAARTEEDVAREQELRAEVVELSKQVERLERELRDRQVGLGSDEELVLPSLQDTLSLSVLFRDKNKPSKRDFEIKYRDIFGIIGSAMYGYVLRRGVTSTYPRVEGYSFEPTLCEFIREKDLEFFGAKSITVPSHQIDALLITFKEMGLVMYENQTAEDGKLFRGFTLTEAGEVELVKVNTATLGTQ